MNKKKLSHRAFMYQLNDTYSDTYHPEEVYELFQGWNNGNIRRSSIYRWHQQRVLGSKLKKYDPIAFYAAYSDQEGGNDE